MKFYNFFLVTKIKKVQQRLRTCRDCKLSHSKSVKLPINVSKDNVLTTTISLTVSFLRKNEMTDYFFVMS